MLGTGTAVLIILIEIVNYAIETPGGQAKRGRSIINNTMEKKPLLKKIDCVVLYVPDLDEGIAFYRDRLGLRLGWRAANAAGLLMPGSDGELVIHSGARGSGTEVDFLVENADEAAKEFEQAGGKVIVPPFETQIGRGVVVEDPWGHELVLLDMSKGRLAVDEHGNVTGNEPPDTGDG